MTRTSGQPMVAAKTERLLNLVIALLYTRRPLTKEQIRASVAQYGGAASDEAFDRMFERDKDELRELGIPLIAAPLDRLFEDDIGYRIDKREYALPEIAFSSQELMVLGLAAKAWEQAALAGPAATAMRKLAAAGVERDGASLVGVEPRVRTVEPAFEGVRSAVVNAYPVTFRYRTGGSGALTTRRVQPWSLTSWHGRWYVTGYDVDRQGPRVFRLGRITGQVRRSGTPGSYDIPADLDSIAMIEAVSADPVPVTAHLLLRDGVGLELRRRAAGVANAEATEPGWSELTVTFATMEVAAGQLAGYGPDVRVLQPPELVEAVIELLRGALRVHIAAVPDAGSPGTS